MNKSTIIKDVIIQGKTTLSGEITTNTAKNSTVAVIAASLINKGKTTLYGVARIADVERLLEAAESLGVKLEWHDNNTLSLTPPKEFNLENLNKEAILRGGRSTILFLAAMVSETSNFNWPHAGGCKMGERTITAHRHSLADLGVTINTTDEYYQVDSTDLHNSETTLYESSDTATETILIAASKIPGTTTINFAQANYMVQEVCFYLEKIGIKIEGIGTSYLKITGAKEINIDVEYHIAEDPIESMMFISAAGTTASNLLIKRCPIEFLRRELITLEVMGLKFTQSSPYLSHNNRTSLVDIEIYPSELTAPVDKIHALPYPGINSDNLPFFVPLATQATGLTLVHDWMWENRAIYFTELNRLGADIRLADPHRVYVNGKTDLKGARVVCPPALRPSMIILVAMLASSGESVLHSVHPINRGYENIFERLNLIGAKIQTIAED